MHTAQLVVDRSILILNKYLLVLGELVVGQDAGLGSSQLIQLT